MSEEWAEGGGITMQPVIRADDDIIRFKMNPIVRFLLDWAQPRGMGLNELAAMPFTDADRMQFAQLIGYSVSGFGDLSYASEEVVAEADRKAKELMAKETTP